MNLLSGYSKNMEGFILLNGSPLTKALRRKIAYVPQFDLFFENLTVGEYLSFSSRLSLSGNFSSEGINTCVNRVLEELHINDITSVQIKYLSGGQRKRCSIGSSLVSLPDFLLLDGMSSFSWFSQAQQSQCLALIPMQCQV
jgi:ABC-type multidrug transport system ATPase subunit